MLKKIGFIGFVLVLAVSTVACALLGSTTEKYLMALKNTSQADSMETRETYEFHMDLSKASKELKEELEKFKDITIYVDQVMDRKNGKQATTAYVDAGEVQLNVKIYGDGENIYIKNPFKDNKYVRFNEQQKNEKNDPYVEKYKENKALYDELADIWKNVVETQIIEREGSSIKNTPDGDIKVTDVSLELSDATLKDILYKVAVAVSKNDLIKEHAMEGSKIYGPKDISPEEVPETTKKVIENLPGHIKEINGHYTLEKLKVSARIDKDNCLIEEGLEGTLVIKSGGGIKIDFKTQVDRWNINRPVEVEIPKIDEEDIEDIEDFTPEDEDFFEYFNIDLSKTTE